MDKKLEKPNLWHNFLYSSSYEVLVLILPFIVAPYITRTLTADVAGTYTYAYTIVSYFVLFTTLGVSVSGKWAIAYNKAVPLNLNKAFSANIIAQLIIASITLIVYYVWCIVTKVDILYWVLSLFVFAGAFNFSWALYGLEKFKNTTLICTLMKIFSVLSIFIFVKSPDDLIIYALINALSMLIQNVITAIVTFKYTKIVKAGFRDVFGAMKQMMIFFIPVISVSLYKTMDKLMIGSITGDMMGVSNYYYAEQILNMPQGILLALSGVVSPRMIALNAEKKEGEKDYVIRNTLIFTCFLSCALAFGIASISSTFVPLYLGDEYVNCGQYIMYLFPTSIMISWTSMMRSQFLIPQRKDSYYILSVVLGAVINLTINFLLIGRIGIKGAIIGTVAAEFTTMLIQTIAVLKIYPLKMHVFNGLPFVLIGLLMFAICSFFGNMMGNSWLTVVIQVITGATIYVALSFVYLKINPHMVSISLRKSKKETKR